MLAVVLAAGSFAAGAGTVPGSSTAPSGAPAASRTTPLIGGDKAALRLVSLAPSMTEVLFALGAGPYVVGVSDHCDHPPEVAGLPRVGSFLLPVVESVLALEPDLVITPPSPGNRNAVEALIRAGVAVEVVGEGTIADLRYAIARLGSRLAMGPEAGRLLARLDAELAALPGAGTEQSRPRVALVLTRRPLVLAGPDSYLGELIELAGGDNIATAAGGPWPRVAWEFLVASAPEVIIDLSMDGVGSTAALKAWRDHGELPAVAGGRVHAPDTGLYARPGPRLGQAARGLAEMIGAK